MFTQSQLVDADIQKEVNKILFKKPQKDTYDTRERVKSKFTSADFKFATSECEIESIYKFLTKTINPEVSKPVHSAVKQSKLCGI